MPVLQFKGKTTIECYHHTVPHHTLEFDSKLSALGKGESQLGSRLVASFVSPILIISS